MSGDPNSGHWEWINSSLVWRDMMEDKPLVLSLYLRERRRRDAMRWHPSAWRPPRRSGFWDLLPVMSTHLEPIRFKTEARLDEERRMVKDYLYHRHMLDEGWLAIGRTKAFTDGAVHFAEGTLYARPLP